MRLTTIFRWDQHQRKYRIGRVLWGKRDPRGGRYARKLSLALKRPWFFALHRELGGWWVTGLGISFHYSALGDLGRWDR